MANSAASPSPGSIPDERNPLDLTLAHPLGTRSVHSVLALCLAAAVVCADRDHLMNSGISHLKHLLFSNKAFLGF